MRSKSYYTEPEFLACYPSPLGMLRIGGTADFIEEISFCGEEDLPVETSPEWLLGRRAVAQLAGYFAGTLSHFDLPLNPAGTLFRQKVWQALRKIPYGETRTYGEIAVFIGKDRAARAVGMANHWNPVSIVIPCHRVVGANRSLTGYAGGLWRKEFLLNLEKTTPEIKKHKE